MVVWPPMGKLSQSGNACRRKRCTLQPLRNATIQGVNCCGSQPLRCGMVCCSGMKRDQIAEAAGLAAVTVGAAGFDWRVGSIVAGVLMVVWSALGGGSGE